jgi:hypothetical protein
VVPGRRCGQGQRVRHTHTGGRSKAWPRRAGKAGGRASEWEARKLERKRGFLFEIEDDGDRTVLSFRQEGLVPKLDCYLQCEAGWDHFLASLSAYVVHGHGNPWRWPLREVAESP